MLISVSVIAYVIYVLQMMFMLIIPNDSIPNLTICSIFEHFLTHFQLLTKFIMDILIKYFHIDKKKEFYRIAYQYMCKLCPTFSIFGILIMKSSAFSFIQSNSE